MARSSAKPSRSSRSGVAAWARLAAARPAVSSHPAWLAVALGLLAAWVAAASLAATPTNNISTVAGTGTAGFSGDGGPAAAAALATPTEVAVTPGGGYLIADQGNSRVRRVLPDGTITTIAGNGTPGFSGDGGPATSAQLNAPNGLLMMPDGGVLIADSNNNRVRRVSPTGTITTVAGTGPATFGGDSGPAASAQLAFPVGLALTPDGGYLIADNDNNRIRRVSPAGTITTVAGTGSPSFGGDGAAATSAQINDPDDVAAVPGGGYLIADANNQRVRLVSADGTITTVAGTGALGFGGDGGPATSAQFNIPINVAVAPDGSYLVNDRNNNRIRRISPAGTIATVAGTGVAGFNGDGGPATAAQVNLPIGVAVTDEGDYLIADALNHRIRAVDAGSAAEPPTAPPVPPPVLGKRVNVEPVSGRVLIATPAGAAGSRSARTAQKGLKFVRLTAARQIPVRSFLDTKKGTVRLVSATPTAGVTQAGKFGAGLFQVLQSGKRRARGLTELRLKGSSFSGCRLRSGRRASAAARRYRGVVRRKLRADVKGKFRTRGRYSAATVRGTVWTTSDRCDGTLTKVSRGTVTVRDFRRKRTVTLRRGKSYLARAPR